MAAFDHQTFVARVANAFARAGLSHESATLHADEALRLFSKLRTIRTLQGLFGVTVAAMCLLGLCVGYSWSGFWGALGVMAALVFLTISLFSVLFWLAWRFWSARFLKERVSR